MTKPIEKPLTKSIIHKPWDVLDSFGQYDATNRNWLEFDDSFDQQIAVLEETNARYIRVKSSAIRQPGR